jgi:hypothetical protein
MAHAQEAALADNGDSDVVFVESNSSGEKTARLGGRFVDSDATLS